MTRESTAADPGSDVGLGWLGVARLGLVQAMLGGVVVLTTSTLNRVMVVELALPALLPGLLVALHYAVQLTRPRMGFGADRTARRTPWIVGGMAVLATSGWLAAVATAWMSHDATAGIALAAVAFAGVGLGVSAAGTSLLTLMATRVQASRRAGAAAVVWVMMIAGFAVTAGVAGRFLDPYTPSRLMLVSGTVSVIALVVTMLSLWRLESGAPALRRAENEAMTSQRFFAALAEVWADAQARRFTVFVFASMVAYSAQDLILEPFAGLVFGFSPGETTRLSGVQHGGTLAGMLLAAMAGRRVAGAELGSLRAWTVGGCIASGVALLGLVVGGLFAAPDWPLRANVFLMGAANGAFSIAAIGSMMALAAGPARAAGPAGGVDASGAGADADASATSSPSAPPGGPSGREGTRMGLWGAAQAIGFAGGGVLGAVASDVTRWLTGSPALAYALVFAGEAVLFVVAARLALRLRDGPATPAAAPRAVDLGAHAALAVSPSSTSTRERP
ncbi:MAG: BCD family MFS transporter [Rubrivivax sp.]|nr:BCD family MFS transporter [Rubrivivax sp.]